MTDIIVREAAVSDIENIMDLERGSIVHPWAKEEFERLISDENKLCLVIENEGGIVCYIGAETVLDECSIGNIVTHKDFRGMGLATKLMAALLSELKERKIAKVFLEVEHDNVPALALYEKAGFVRYGYRRGYYGAGKDAVLMSLDL